MTKRNSIADMKEEVAGWRRELHANPGVMYQEKFASDFVAAKLSEWGILHKRGLAETGIVATIEGKSNTSGKAIGIRADMDALPITEKSGQPWASTVPGVMHACGHDGHTASLLGIAKYLSENNNFDGKVNLIFQPAEEGGHGAHRMIEDGLFKDFPCDEVYGFHNWPYMPVGHAGINYTKMMAAVDHFDITVNGQGGHAAYPHKSVDPVIVASQIVIALQTLVSRYSSPVEPLVVTVTNVNVGTGAYNVIDDKATIRGTVRVFDKGLQRENKERMEKLVQSIAISFGATAEMVYESCLASTINHEVQAKDMADIMASLIGEENIDRNIEPSMGGEDFGAMMEEVPGAYINIGQGTGDKKSPHDQGLHSPFYDFNDDILPVAIDFFAELVERKLG